MLLLDVGNLVKHPLQLDDGGFAVELEIFRHPLDHRQQRITDLAELFAVGADIRKHLALDRRSGRLPERDVDETELASDRAHERGKWTDILHDIAREWKFEDRHAFLRILAEQDASTFRFGDAESG